MNSTALMLVTDGARSARIMKNEDGDPSWVLNSLYKDLRQFSIDELGDVVYDLNGNDWITLTEDDSPGGDLLERRVTPVLAGPNKGYSWVYMFNIKDNSLAIWKNPGNTPASELVQTPSCSPMVYLDELPKGRAKQEKEDMEKLLLLLREQDIKVVYTQLRDLTRVSSAAPMSW